MTANFIKNAILSYFRFKRGFEYVATEVFDCDVVVSDGRCCIEIEVKTNWRDYTMDKRKPFFSQQRQALLAWKRDNPVWADVRDPNRSFWAAPEPLAQRIVEDDQHNVLDRGVLSISDKGIVTIARRSKSLHTNPISEKSQHYILFRMSSELITLRQQVRHT